MDCRKSSEAQLPEIAVAAPMPTGLFAFLAFAFVFFAGISFALPWDGAALTCFSGVSFYITSEFNQMIIAATMLAILIIAFAYMVSQVLERQELAFWAKTEAQNLLISAMLIGVVLAAFGVGCSVLTAQAGTSSPFAAVDGFLQKMYNEHGLGLTSELISRSMDDQLRAVSYIYWSVPVLGGKGIAYKANWRAVSQHREMVADLQLPILVSLQVQRLAFMMLNQAVFSALLPAAILFRMLFITRDVGNFLIALSFGIFFAMPLVYLMAYQAYDKLPTPADIEVDFAPDSPKMLGSALLRIGYLAPAAILVPNLALVLVISFTMAASKALKGIGV